ncbi:MAG: zinc ribbon domain-containing protein [Chloroflexi bacterium]|nr:zinc ribbon domain-containing protein [Chloroflexota bacterium]
MFKRISFLATLVLLVFGWVAPVAAEDSLRITSLSVSVWPEYDQPGVLVQYEGTISATASKTNPRELSFLVPKGAGVGAACAVQSNGNHTSETWKETEGDEGWTKIIFQVTEPDFHVEYYYNPLTSAPDKKMTFTYQALLPADEVEVDVQHPLKATNFVLTPETINSHKDNDGFTYHSYVLKQMSAGQKVSTNIAYTKTDPSPSVSGQKNAATISNASNDNNLNLNQVIVFSIMVGMLGIIVYFVWERNTRRAQPSFATAPFQAASHRARAEWFGGFCTQCGNPMQTDDNFCARCGTPR